MKKYEDIRDQVIEESDGDLERALRALEDGEYLGKLFGLDPLDPEAEDPEIVKAHEEAQEVVERVYSEIASIVEAQKQEKKMRIYVHSMIEDADFEAFESLDDALKHYAEARKEDFDDTVEDEDEIYLASGVDEKTGKRYYVIHNNAEYGVSCTPASLAKFYEWWDESWDSDVY